MNKLENWLSYIYPISIEVTSSEVNSFLEVVFSNGSYQLNSENINYSYGGLYELFKHTFREVKIGWENVNDVLVLGFGAGCIVPLIQKYKSDPNIIGVEIDEKVIELGRMYFNTPKLKNTVVVCNSALNYTTNTNLRFDLVIIDAYVDYNVPGEVETLSFLQSLKNILNRDGMVIFNKFLFSKKVKMQVPMIKSVYQEVFGEVELYTIMETGQYLWQETKIKTKVNW